MIAAHRLMQAFNRLDVDDAEELIDTRLWNCGILSIEERHALRDAMLTAKSVPAYTDLIREGDDTGSLFIVLSGWACRYATTNAGARQLSAIMVPGDVGNLGSLMFDRLGYGMRTLTKATVVALPRQRALTLAAEHPGIGRAFTWLSLIENAILSQWTLSLGRRLSIERLAHFLCELSARLGAERDNQSRFAFPLTQETIADMLGLTPIHVNRKIQQLRASGLVVNVDRTMWLPDVARLRALGGFDPGYLHLGGPQITQII
ncbi:Crp/Fnr family transcriptional regulator [Sphingomonas cynarae]|uniref:Crp/Fnr family transcriptional regulator n=1 Tax=Sphingomonas cynarae TaxID=930197 RepID=A0ABP7DSM6_9SPHN